MKTLYLVLVCATISCGVGAKLPIAIEGSLNDAIAEILYYPYPELGYPEEIDMLELQGLAGKRVKLELMQDRKNKSHYLGLLYLKEKQLAGFHFFEMDSRFIYAHSVGKPGEHVKKGYQLVSRGDAQIANDLGARLKKIDVLESKKIGREYFDWFKKEPRKVYAGKITESAGFIWVFDASSNQLHRIVIYPFVLNQVAQKTKEFIFGAHESHDLNRKDEKAFRVISDKCLEGGTPLTKN